MDVNTHLRRRRPCAVEPPLHLIPAQLDSKASFISPPWTSPTQSQNPSFAGAPPPPTQPAVGRRSTRSRRHRPPRAAPKPPREITSLADGTYEFIREPDGDFSEAQAIIELTEAPNSDSEEPKSTDSIDFTTGKRRCIILLFYATIIIIYLCI